MIMKQGARLVPGEPFNFIIRNPMFCLPLLESASLLAGFIYRTPLCVAELQLGTVSTPEQEFHGRQVYKS